MADTILIITQISAVSAVLMGLIAIGFMAIASRRLVKDAFRGFILRLLTFYVLTLVGTGMMALYHFYWSEALSKLLESLWYIFMFLALLYSGYVSLNIISFGKKFEAIAQKSTSLKKEKVRSNRTKRAK